MLEVKQLTTVIADHEFQWSFSLREKQLVAVVGGSGIGKTSLLNTLLGFCKAVSGEVLWHGRDVSAVPIQKKPFGILFQNNNLFEHLTVEKNLSLGLEPSGRLDDRQKALVSEAANRFQINTQLSKKASNLSGGQQQRVALARVFLQSKPILLLDEPFSALDPDLRAEGLLWVKDMQRERGTTVILVTHHLMEVRSHADSVLEGVSSTSWTQYAAQ